MILRWRELTKDNCTKCTTTISTTLFCICNRTRKTAMPAPVFLQTWNGFEINPPQDNNQIRQKIIGDLVKLQSTRFDVLAISNVSFTPLYKGVKTCCLDMQTHTYTRLNNNFKCQTSAEIVLHQKFTQNFSTTFISQKFQSLKEFVSNLCCIANTTDCISSVQLQTYFFVILFEQKSLACVLEKQKSLAVVLEHWKSLDCVQEHRKSLVVVLE